MRKAALAYADATVSFFNSIDGNAQENKTAALGATIATLVDEAHSEKGYSINVCEEALSFAINALREEGFDILKEVDK